MHNTIPQKLRTEIKNVASNRLKGRIRFHTIPY